MARVVPRKRTKNILPELNKVTRDPIVAKRFPTSEKWDVDLTTDQVKALGPKDKKARVFEAMCRKVEILEDCARNPQCLLREPSIPTNRKGLREWSDPARGLWSWVWVSLDSPSHGKNGAVIDAFFDAVRDIEKATASKQSGLKRELNDRDLIIHRYEKRLAELLHEVLELRMQVHTKRDRT